MLTAVVKDEHNDNTIMALPLVEKTFSTGSKGYHGQGKALIDGKRYQINFMLIEIGSKPRP